MFFASGIWRLEVFWAGGRPGFFWLVSNIAQPGWVLACRSKTFWAGNGGSSFQEMLARVFLCGMGRCQQKAGSVSIVSTFFQQIGWSRVVFFVLRNKKQNPFWCERQKHWWTCVGGWWLQRVCFLFLPILLQRVGWVQMWLRLRRPRQNLWFDNIGRVA